MSKIHIYIDTIYKFQIEIDVLMTDSIEYVKSLIQDKIGVHPDCQYLYYNDKYIDDNNKCIYDYNIQNNSVMTQKLYISEYP